MTALATFLFYLLLLLGVVKTTTPVKEYDVPRGESIFDVVSGVWGWPVKDLGCSTNPHTIRFTADRSQMLIGHILPDSSGAQRVTRYDILDVGPSRLRARIIGETRMTESGTPVVWDLVLTSHDSYRWHRTDMANWMMTADIKRCLGANETSAAVDSAASFTTAPWDP